MEATTILSKLKTHTPSILGSEDFSKFAILLPLIQKGGEIYVLFEVRSRNLRRQPGEICFPGGKIDAKDKTEKDAALRETEEELRISREVISHVFPLDYLVSPFGMIVYTYAGFINHSVPIQPNLSEVEETFMVPLSFFLETEPRVHQVKFEAKPAEDFPFDLIVGGHDYNWQTRQLDEYFYVYEDKVIWGMTAKILAHFVEMIQ